MTARTTIKLDDDVRAVLTRSAITTDRLVLPPEQLERKLYERVNKVLVAAGGKWDRRAKAHVFTADPRQALGLAVETGEILHEKNAFQVFETPAELAARMVMDLFSGLPQGHQRILEPSAGSGRLVQAVFDGALTSVTAIEIRPEACDQLRTDEFCFQVLNFDFLLVSPAAFKPFDGIVMNPPFTKGQDAKHILHAWKFLRPGGRLVALASPAVLSGTRGPYKELATLLDGCGAITEEIPAGTFRAEGTDIATILIIADKPLE